MELFVFIVGVGILLVLLIFMASDIYTEMTWGRPTTKAPTVKSMALEAQAKSKRERELCK